ncbi:MAG: flagellar biosynthesis protein FlgM [Cyanobacteria bacterium P01_F01_bin.143]
MDLPHSETAFSQTIPVPTSKILEDDSNPARELLVRERPFASQGATQISVGLYVIDIFKIDEAQQSFEADFFIEFRWKDPHLVKSEAENSIASCRKHLDEIWHPAARVFNERNLNKNFETTLVVADGTVVSRQRFHGLMSSPLNLRRFPFDEQTLRIQIMSFVFSPEEVQFTVNNQLTGLTEEVSLPNWSTDNPFAHNGSRHIAHLNQNFVCFDYELKVKRYSGYYISRVMLPLILIVSMSYAVFWFPPEEAMPQIAISVTAVLTLVTYEFTLQQSLPRVPYLTVLDKFVMGSMILVFLALVETVATIELTGLKQQVLALDFDLWLRWAFPFLLSGLVAIAFWL